MGLTITEKILRNHCQDKSATAGDFILVDIDKCLANDITAPIAIEVFEEVVSETTGGVFNSEKVILVPDHFTPNKDIASAIQSKTLREFTIKHNIVNYYEVGRGGIEHCLIPEKGLVAPGDVFIGADSHTCTYGALGAFATGVGSTDLGVAMATGKCWLKIPESIKLVFSGRLGKWISGKDLILHIIGNIGVDGASYKAMEFSGEILNELSIADRLTICNMAIEAGAKNGIIAPDNLTISYLEANGFHLGRKFSSDPNAEYVEKIEIICDKIESQVAFPHSPENVKPISEVNNMSIELDQVVIGSCTNGRIEDLRIVAKILKNNKVSPTLRCIIIPGTQETYLKALKEGLIEIFITAGAIVSTPTCGPCLGGHMGILGEGEIALSTTNRNFRGRMGHISSDIYLSSPAVAAFSAIKGYIASPQLL